MAAMMNPRVDLARYTAQDFARAERRRHQLRALEGGGAAAAAPEVVRRRRSWVRLPVPVTRAAVNPA